MKNLVCALVVLALTNLTFSQNDLAVAKVNNKSVTVKKATINSNFMRSLASADMSKRIETFQNLTANYNIKTNPVYTSNKPATYTVVFKEDNNQITNLYDHNGEILSSEQSFSDIKLPYALSSTITKEHPGWSIHKVTCKIAYTKGQAADIVYKVTLKNNGQTKTLKITG
jgi:hypothetical protein